MFFLFLIMLLILYILILMSATIKIKIKDLKIELPKQEERIIDNDYEISLNFYIFKKMKIFKLSITKDKLERKELKEQVNKIKSKLKKDKNNFDIKFIDIIKKISIEKANLVLYLGTENAAFTAVTLGIISTILGIILNEKSIFKIVPIYQDRNILNLQFDGIFVLNKIHIIDIIIYVLKTKRRVNKNGRSSNRRAYAYSNE
mgnify:FL=1